jgi:23S rRNA maturation mini-RNase III
MFMVIVHLLDQTLIKRNGGILVNSNMFKKEKARIIKRIIEKLDAKEHEGMWKRYENTLIHRKEENEKYRYFDLIQFMYYSSGTIPNDYLYIRNHLKKLMQVFKLQNIVDIGCHSGTQSEVFYNDIPYIGIDNRATAKVFFNANETNVTYLFGNYPTEVDLDLSKSVVIVASGIGYPVDPNTKDEKSIEHLVLKLAEAPVLYTNKQSPIL